MLSTFGNKCPQNGSKNEPRAPRTSMGCPHEGPRAWKGHLVHGRVHGGVRVLAHHLGIPCNTHRVQGSGFRIQGAGCRVQGSGFRVQGLEAPRPARQPRRSVQGRLATGPLRPRTQVIYVDWDAGDPHQKTNVFLWWWGPETRPGLVSMTKQSATRCTPALQSAHLSS